MGIAIDDIQAKNNQLIMETLQLIVSTRGPFSTVTSPANEREADLNARDSSTMPNNDVVDLAERTHERNQKQLQLNFFNNYSLEDSLTGANSTRLVAKSLTSNQLQIKPKNWKAIISEALCVHPRVYVEGMAYIDSKIQTIERELSDIQCDYHKVDNADDSHLVDYIQTCSNLLLFANAQFKKHSIPLEVIDSEKHFVVLLNNIRQINCDLTITDKLSEYWNNLKSAVTKLTKLVENLEQNVLKRLKDNYLTTISYNKPLKMYSLYMEDITGYMIEVDTLLLNTSILLRSFYSGLHKDLFQPDWETDSMLATCDVKAFPILCLVRDVSLKIRCICHLGHVWLNRDLTFMHEVQCFIRNVRRNSKNCDEKIKAELKKQKKYEKDVQTAKSVLQSNCKKLDHIESDIRRLDQQLENTEHRTQLHYSRLHQRENMVDFFNVTLSQIKNNYNLKKKRSKLSNEVEELRAVLWSMQETFEAIQSTIELKEKEKAHLSEEVEDKQKSYATLNSDLSRFIDNLQQLESETKELSRQLVELEMIHSQKSNPENVERFYDRPSSIKIAQSLKKKIREKCQNRTGRKNIPVSVWPLQI